MSFGWVPSTMLATTHQSATLQPLTKVHRPLTSQPSSTG